MQESEQPPDLISMLMSLNDCVAVHQTVRASTSWQKNKKKQTHTEIKS